MNIAYTGQETLGRLAMESAKQPVLPVALFYRRLRLPFEGNKNAVCQHY
jgi:hypothetical protein